MGRRRALFAGLAAATALAAGCGQDAGGSATQGDRAACATRGNHWVGEALLHVPPRPVRNQPLVVAFHGAGGNGNQMRASTGLSDLADERGFAVLYPTAARNAFWTLTADRRPDDIPRVAALIERVIALACVDARRVYATGLSNGGGFAARAGCELADRFAAVAPVAGGYRALERCPAGRRTALLEIHGMGDTVVPYRGRGPRREGDVRRFVAQWARRDGCAPRPQITRPSAGVQRVRYRGCAPGLAVEHLRIEDEPHGWPADTSEIVWRFFEGRRQPER